MMDQVLDTMDLPPHIRSGALTPAAKLFPAKGMLVPGVPVLNVTSPVKVSVVSGVMLHVRSPPKSGVELEPRLDCEKFWIKYPT